MLKRERIMINLDQKKNIDKDFRVNHHSTEMTSIQNRYLGCSFKILVAMVAMIWEICLEEYSDKWMAGDHIWDQHVGMQSMRILEDSLLAIYSEIKEYFEDQVVQLLFIQHPLVVLIEDKDKEMLIKLKIHLKSLTISNL